MSVTMRCVECYSKLLNMTLYTNFVSVRYLPRWKHRSPIGVVSSELTEKEKELWRLHVEREMNAASDSLGRIDSELFSGVSATNTSEERKHDVAHSVNKNISSAAGYSSEKSKAFASKLMNGNEGKTSSLISNFEPEKSKGFASKLMNDNEGKTSSLISNFEHKNTKKRNVNNKTSMSESEKAAKLRISASKLGVPMFTDLETNDTLLSKYMTNVKSKKRREKKGLVLLEGKRLIRDALDTGIVPDVVFFSRISDLKNLNLPQTGTKIYKTTFKCISQWSEVETPQGVLAFMKVPNLQRKEKSSLPLTVICDNIRDPGNMGTILRTCAGIGCNQVLLTKGCVDLWEPKVLRAAAGAHFRLFIENNVEWNNVMSHLTNDSCAFVAENNLSNKKEPLSCSPAHQQDLDLTSDETNSCEENNSSLNQSPDLSLPPVIPYYAFDYNSVDSIVLIIGGETKGVSVDAYKMVTKSGGVRLNVPLSNGVESLNVGTALGIIGFEVKKQLLTTSKSEEPKSEAVVQNV